MRLWRSAVLIALTGLACAGAAAGGGKAAWFVSGSLAGLALIGLAAGFALKGQVAVNRVLAERPLHAGDALRVEGTAELPFRFPLVFVLIADEWVNERTGRTVKGAALVMPMGRRRVPFCYELARLERGVYRLRESEAGAVDFFDLAGFHRRFPAPGDAPPGFVVGPARTALSGGARDGARRADPDAAGGVRPYAAGDPVGRIDWKTTLRIGRPMVKTPETEEGSPVLVRIDPGRGEADFERALGAAAAFVRMREAAWKAGSRERDAMLAAEEGEPLSLLWDGEAALLRRLALMERPAAGQPAEAGTKRMRRGFGEPVVLLAAGRLDHALADAALALSGAGPVRVLAAPENPPGEAEWRLVSRLGEYGVRVAFARPVWPRQGHRGAGMAPSGGEADGLPQADGRAGRAVRANG